jgi:hypothetical protein
MTTPVLPTRPLVAREIRRRRQLRLARYRAHIALTASVPPRTVGPRLSEVSAPRTFAG